MCGKTWTFWQKMAILRTSISLSALLTAIGVAYLAIRMGLGSKQLLSPANTDFAIKTGILYGGILLVPVNCIPYKNRENTTKVASFTILGLHLIFGLCLMIWTAVSATV